MIKRLFALAILFMLPSASFAVNGSDLVLPQMNLNFASGGSPTEIVNVLKMVVLLTVLTLAPAIIVMMTSFTRVVIVLSFLRQSLGTQQMPPNQVVIGLSLFLSFFIMAPTWEKISSHAIDPFVEERISQTEAFSNAEEPLREFMFSQVRDKELELFLGFNKAPRPQTKNDVPTYVLIPAFIVSELNTAFQMGFMLYLPFMVIDMVVASILMAMGMMMLPPMMISLPFKILLFVLVDGWGLVVGSIVKSFG